MTDAILVERDGTIATVILNRPDKLNAMTKAMWGRLGDAMTELDRDDRLRCIILRGAGSKAFSPGNDISRFAEERSTAAQARDYATHLHHAFSALKSCRHPTVARIEGICVGGGLEIAALCDLRIAGESSRFGVPINKLGLVMAYPEIDVLRALVGPAVTLEILLEGRIFGAHEAKEKGLVTRVVADAEVAAEVRTTAERIAAGAPLVARWHKKFVARLADPAPLTDAELAEGYGCYDTEDFKIGYKAFLAKEKPAFKGR